MAWPKLALTSVTVLVIDKGADKPWRPTLQQVTERRTRSRGAIYAALGVTVVALSGCSTNQPGKLWLPGAPDTTNHTGKITDLWVGSWIAAMAVGVLVWGLMLWCIVAYRRKPGETGAPEQIKYHVPLEIMYTVLPLMMVGVLFFYTARDQAAIQDTSKPADVHINVVAKQWSWDFNYLDADVYESGVQADLSLDGKPGVEKTLPTLYLPVNKNIEFTLNARDVDHSFWIPAFLYKLDNIPGVTNKFQVIPQKIGDYKGKCTELCGEFHSEMLFNVKVVSQADYDARMAELRAKGQTGSLSVNLGRAKTGPGKGAVPDYSNTGSNE